MSDIDLLIMPRADLPVIWDAFKAQVEEFRETAETLIVTDVSQKEKMELACRTRLTLRKIRIAVEHKRVELGEGHLKEIQKVNGAAKAIREFIEPLEARLLVQESFAERAEDERILKLASHRRAELSAFRPGGFISELGSMSQPAYDALLASYRQEKAELEEANRLRVEAEKRLAEAQAKALLDAEIALAEKAADNARRAEAWTETQRNEQAIRAEAQKREIEFQLELKAESDRLKAEAFRVAEIAQRVALEEKQRRDAEAEQLKTEQEVKLAAERSAAEAIRTLERVEAEKRRQADLQIEREKTAKLEAELAQERAAKQAEADAARRLAVAPDLEQLQGFSRHLQQICKPVLKTIEAEACLSEAVRHFANAIFTIDKFICDRS